MSDKHERHVAKLVRGRKIPGSGAFAGSKGDVTSKKFRIECKTTSKKSIALSVEWLHTVALESLGDGRTPVVSIRFEHPSLGNSDTYYVLHERDFETLFSI